MDEENSWTTDHAVLFAFFLSRQWLCIRNGYAHNRDSHRKTARSQRSSTTRALTYSLGLHRHRQTLTIDLANGVEYQGDIGDASKFEEVLALRPRQTGLGPVRGVGADVDCRTLLQQSIRPSR